MHIYIIRVISCSGNFNKCRPTWLNEHTYGRGVWGTNLIITAHGFYNMHMYTPTAEGKWAVQRIAMSYSDYLRVYQPESLHGVCNLQLGAH